ncbi:uncharacterized protein LOC128559471 [Mercenaria mercenaria]|uniref:uncharacterized protein LOC128559471 n=1 Tax=Mercenaria mercenaria TaxID=6596 RepID=UPI00234E5E95|nr:uncharacterized protein LOC128559471 [Mercenaria mercenaria]
MSCSGIGEGDTVTYSCNAGYIISSGSVTRECINSQWSGIQPTCAEIVVVCHPNNSIDVFNLHADYYFNAIQNVTNGGPIEKCSISDINSTAVTITGCLKDFPILFTIGPYNGIELYTLHGGKDVVIVQILCNEIPGSCKVHFIDNTYNVGLGVAEHKGITVTPGVTSVLNPTSAVVGDPVAWTTSIPSEYILEVTSCEGYPGIDALSNVSISLISSGGCNATSHLITHFSDAYDGTVTATLSAFKFYNYDNVFLYVT